MSIRLAIIGYGNLGRGVELAVRKCKDIELTAVFTRRAPELVSLATPGVSVYPIDAAQTMSDCIDVAVICGGSATDLPVQTPHFARLFNVVDSFDTHAKINDHFANVNAAATESGKIGIISVGWDPGLFSLNRLLSDSLLPGGNTYTFWGEGVSQGHSDAIRRVKGVKSGVQYTIPVKAALKKVRDGENPVLSTRERHIRRCYVVASEGADNDAIASEIKNMPNYFADYDTEVHFITEDEFRQNHSAMPHGGFVIHSGKTGAEDENAQLIEYSLRLGSNPEFTAGVLVAYARAAYRMNKSGDFGCKTVFDVPPGLLSPLEATELRRRFL